MPDAWWNTVTGPPGPNLLYDPPFLHVYGTDFTTFVPFDPDIDLTWSTPTYHGIPFASVSGTEITFDCQCSVILSMEPAINVDAASEGIMQFAFGGTIFGTSAYYSSAFGYYQLSFNAVSNLYLSALWTTPPFRVETGATLTLTERVALSTGSTTDQGTQVIVTRVA